MDDEKLMYPDEYDCNERQYIGWIAVFEFRKHNRDWIPLIKKIKK